MSGRRLSGTPPRVGSTLPEATLFRMVADKNEKISTSELFALGKTVVLFALPGAFTPG